MWLGYDVARVGGVWFKLHAQAAYNTLDIIRCVMILRPPDALQEQPGGQHAAHVSGQLSQQGICEATP